jgi:hypothetical protein
VNNNQEAVKEGRNGLLIIDERNGPTNDGTLPHPKINIIMEESCKMGFFFATSKKSTYIYIASNIPCKIQNIINRFFFCFFNKFFLKIVN